MNAGKITTFSHRRLDPLNPDPAAIYLPDIAHALALTCRFKGHCREFYSVAEHSVRVSRLLDGGAAPLALWGLMHDAAEAYLSDVSAPIKSRMFVQAGGKTVSFAAAEDRLLEVIAQALGFPAIDYAAVRGADLTLLVTEARDLLGIDARTWGVSQAALTDVITPWPWQEAKRLFIERFGQLTRA